MSEVGHYLIAESALRHLHASYADAVLRKDVVAFVDCFADDADWHIAGLVLHGHGEIRHQITKFLDATERVWMQLGMPIFEIQHGTASGRIPVTELVKMPDGRALQNLGVYYDRYVYQGARWRFRWRHWSHLYRGPPDLSAHFFECADHGPPPNLPDQSAPTNVTGRRVDRE